MKHIKLFSATGVLVGMRREKQAQSLIRNKQAKWRMVGVELLLLHLTDAEIAALDAKLRQRRGEDKADAVEHMGQWRVVQPRPNRASPAGWQLQHPGGFQCP